LLEQLAATVTGLHFILAVQAAVHNKVSAALNARHFGVTCVLFFEVLDGDVGDRIKVHI
jgi:hypothetical protein